MVGVDCCFISSGLFSITYTHCCPCASLHARVLMHHLVKVNVLNYLSIPREKRKLAINWHIIWLNFDQSQLCYYVTVINLI